MKTRRTVERNSSMARMAIVTVIILCVVLGSWKIGYDMGRKDSNNFFDKIKQLNEEFSEAPEISKTYDYNNI